MKTLSNITVILLSAFVLASCESWLDASPTAQIKESNQFSNEQGFRDALYGVYTQATSPALYGDRMTMGMLTAMTYSYSSQGRWSGYFMSACQYDYANASVKVWIDSIWNQAYTTISHANLILKNADAKKGVMTNDVYNVVKGEMLGLRAYIHFDLFRLFAPAYTQTADLTKLSIPYRDEYGIKPAAPLSMQDFAARLLKDITDAEGYLKNYREIDQLGTQSTGVVTDDFMAYRQNRFNYYALKALEARVSLWLGQNTKAAAAAREVIGSGRFYFEGSDEANNDDVAKNNVFTPELIFALYDSKMQKRSDSYFTEIYTTNTTSRLQTSTSYVNNIYETSAGGSSDLRYVNWFGTYGTGNYCKKYRQMADTPIAVKFQLPLIRLGEMYLILAEATSDPEVLNELKTARAIVGNATAANLTEEIRKEFIKDLYAEGQLFYYYKRRNIAVFPNSSLNTVFTFPIPENEMIYGEY